MSQIVKEEFGHLPKDNEIVYKYTLMNAKGMKVSVINYGGIITNIMVPDRSGGLVDVVLGYDHLDGYVEDIHYLGAIVGRFSNRIRHGKFMIDDTSYQLTRNDHGHHLHGGFNGFSKQYWDIKALPKKNTLELDYLSPDEEEGYPGNLEVKAYYSLTEKNELIIDFTAMTDRPTLANLAQHSYFNLSGIAGSSILDHQLQIKANDILAVDDDTVPTGSFISVKGTPWDFNHPKEIGRDIETEELKTSRGYDHYYILTRSHPALMKMARLWDEKSDLAMEVWTDMPGVQLYSANFLDGCIGKGLTPYPSRSGICLETQNFPDAPNHEHFPDPILRPGQKWSSRTVFKFF